MQFRIKPWLALATAVASLTLTAQEQTPVQRGISAFDAGDYQLALDLFEQAEAGGNEALSVDYNIAVSLYRLGRHVESERRFRQLEGLPEWEILVNYNLGLVLEAQGRRSEARPYFERAAAQDEQEKIRELANNKLSTLDRTARVTDELAVSAAATKSWAAQVELTGGVDSNASSLADSLLEQSDRGEDSFSQLLLYGHVYATGESGDGLRLYGLGFNRRFADLDYLNSRVIGLGAVWEQAIWGWRSELGVSLLATTLDDRDVADQSQIRGALWRRFSTGSYKIGLSYSDINAGSGFPQIDGDRYRAELSWSKRFGSLEPELRFRQEWNNRRDLSRGGGFASYSPIRASLQGKLGFRFDDHWRTYLEAEYIDSDYRDSNRLRDVDGQVKTAPRENRKLRLTTGLSYRFGSHWRAELEYQFEDSDDAFELYSYDKNRVQASIVSQF